jgi:hypothetical protein
VQGQGNQRFPLINYPELNRMLGYENAGLLIKTRFNA